jgi:catechol-2,3-dioxygenase
MSIDVPVPARQRGKIAPVKLAHLVLRTSNAKRLVDWYCTVLEAQSALDNGMLYFLTYDDEHHRLAVMQLPGVKEAPSGSASGLEHFAFTYEDADALFATYERLKAAGILPYWCVNHGPTLSMYYRDPDGNQVELQIDLFDSIEATNAWFAQSDFVTNPIGVKFEPEDVIRRYRAGEPPTQLFRRPVIDPSKVREQFPS